MHENYQGYVPPELSEADYKRIENKRRQLQREIDNYGTNLVSSVFLLIVVCFLFPPSIPFSIIFFIIGVIISLFKRASAKRKLREYDMGIRR